MKILMFIGVIMFASDAYAQTTATTATNTDPSAGMMAGPSTTNTRPQRLLSMYLCGGTGNLNPDTGHLMSRRRIQVP